VAPFDYKEAVRPDRRHSEEGHPHHLYLCVLDMPYTSGSAVADLHTMSDRKDHRPTSQEIIQINNPTYTSFSHNFLPPSPWDHPSITSPLKISSHLHQNQKIPVLLLCSLTLSVYRCFIVFIVFSVFFFYNSVQPLATILQ